jgi:hypothetical protein
MDTQAEGTNSEDQTGDAAAYQRAQIEDILRRLDALPILDTRPEDEILGY